MCRNGVENINMIKLFLQRLDEIFLTENAPKTFFHGTVIDNLDSIKKHGLSAQIGNFIDTMYDDEGIEPDPLVFLTDKEGLHKAVTAMRFHVGKKIGKSVGEVNAEDVRKHGLLLKVMGEPDEFNHKPEDPMNDYEEHPYGVEPGDYYSFGDVGPEGYFFGNKLIALLNRYGLMSEFTYNLGELDDITRKKLKAQLINLAMKKYPDEDKQKIINMVNNMNDKKLISNTRKYLK